MNVITANPIILDNVHINTNDMYVALDGSSPKSETKAFQDWLDAKGLKWVKATNTDLTNGSKLNKGSGYGNFGPSTSKAWNRYGNEYSSIVPNKSIPRPSNPNTSTPSSESAPTSEDAAPIQNGKENKGFVAKFKALSTTKKVLYIAVPLVLIVTIIVIVKRGKNIQ